MFGVTEKQDCKGEPFMFSGWRDPSVLTEMLLLYNMDLGLSLASVTFFFFGKICKPIEFLRKILYF